MNCVIVPQSLRGFPRAHSSKWVSMSTAPAPALDGIRISRSLESLSECRFCPRRSCGFVEQGTEAGIESREPSNLARYTSSQENHEPTGNIASHPLLDFDTRSTSGPYEKRQHDRNATSFCERLWLLSF